MARSSPYWIWSLGLAYKGFSIVFHFFISKVWTWKHVCRSWSVLTIPMLAGWIFSHRSLTAGERLVVFALGAISLVCLAGMVYVGYRIIGDFSVLSAAMGWWSLSKITWFFVQAILFYGYSRFL